MSSGPKRNTRKPRYTTQMVKLGDLAKMADPRIPTYRPFIDAFKLAMDGVTTPDAEDVPVSTIVVPEGFWVEDGVAVMLADLGARYLERRREGHRVWLLRRPDGSLWTYDDCHYVIALQRAMPDAIVPAWVMQHP